MSYKPLLIGGLLMALLDSIAVITMIKRPDLSDRAILGLLFIQLFGAIGIAGSYLLMRPGQEGATNTAPVSSGQNESGHAPGRNDLKTWALFSISAAFFIRSFASFAEIISGNSRKGTGMMAVVEIVISVLLFSWAWKIRRGRK
jgi:hypothetical protein